MQTQFITIRQSEDRFLDFLWGRKNDVLGLTKRAIPVKTYLLGTPNESVTFEIQEISQIQKPNFFVFVASLIKLNTFSIILFPLLFVLTKNNWPELSNLPLSFFLAILASLFLFAGLNLHNDVFDHISGYDRVNLDANRKPIRLGWISAYQASRLSLGFILISTFFAIPTLFLQPKLMGLVFISFILFFIGRFEKNNSYKQQHLGEFILFLLVGPILVSGYQLAIGETLDGEILSFGALWGFVVFYLIQVNNFSHIMTSSQSGIQNTMTKLGFDKSQKFLSIAWILLILLWGLFYYYYASRVRTIFNSVLFFLISVPYILKILKIRSPMGSGLQRVRQAAYQVYLIWMLIFMSSFFVEKILKNGLQLGFNFEY